MYEMVFTDDPFLLSKKYKQNQFNFIMPKQNTNSFLSTSQIRRQTHGTRFPHVLAQPNMKHAVLEASHDTHRTGQKLAFVAFLSSNTYKPLLQDSYQIEPVLNLQSVHSFLHKKHKTFPNIFQINLFFFPRYNPKIYQRLGPQAQHKDQIQKFHT